MGKRRTVKKVRQAEAESKIGYDGNPPAFREARDLQGSGRREKIAGPQNINIDRLEWMLAHRLIEPHHHSAGRKFQRHWEDGQISAGISLVGGGGGGSPSTSLSDKKCDALTAVKAARAALSPMNFRLIELVVIDRMSAQAAAAKMRFPDRAAMPTLMMALDQLARHYRLC